MSTYTGNLPEVLEPWVTKLFFNEYNQLDQIHPRIFNIEPSTRHMEDTFEVSPLGTFVLKPEGTPVSYDDPVQSGRKRVVHSTYAMGFRVTMEMMEDDQHSIIRKMPADLGEAARNHKENLAFGLLNDAFAGATYQGIPEGDGVRRSLCHTGHVHLKAGGPSSNEASPGVSLSVSGLEAAITNYRLTQDEAGRQIQLQPGQIVVHPDEEFNVHQIINSEKEPYTNENQPNTVSTSRMGWDVVQSPYLTDRDAWFLLAPKSQHTLKWYDRKKLTFSNSKDSETKDSKFDALYRASVTFDKWRGAYGSQP